MARGGLTEIGGQQNRWADVHPAPAFAMAAFPCRHAVVITSAPLFTPGPRVLTRTNRREALNLDRFLAGGGPLFVGGSQWEVRGRFAGGSRESD